jgi:Fe-S-cluster containining protein
VSLPGLPKSAIAHVDCGACHACCQGLLIVLFEQHGDDPSEHDWCWATVGGQRLKVLKTKPNQDCAHFTATGCGIYAKRPAMCRKFDCAGFARVAAETKFAAPTDAVYAEGKRRLDAQAGRR